MSVFHVVRLRMRSAIFSTTLSRLFPNRSTNWCPAAYRRFNATTPSATIPLLVRAEGSGVALAVTTAGEKSHSFRTDALPSFGGKDSAPSPLFYVLASLGSCNQVTASLVARDLGVRLGAWKLEVQGDLNPQVLVHGTQGNSNFDKVQVRVTVQSDATSEQFAQLVAETERRCPISQLFKRSGLQFDNVWEKAPL